ncbi:MULTISPECIES: hypothetical protein [Streptomyces]|uniref:hypothetical protein n=2 Tax=Streptomyces TaxID=1883 RepID=UPI0024BA8BA4|nr:MULTISPECIES: hypothetical protein [Streptomyces]MDJ0380841.1 hypothetical protein [Streptomyces sp. G-G2]WIY77374.1 hypothetical protein QPM16_18175 [Streptomyces anulatus]
MNMPLTVAELAHPIALELGGNWRPQPARHGVKELDHAATFTHLDGRQLHLSERFDDPGHLHIRGAFPATDYPFRRGERDTVRVAMTEDPADIAARIAADLIPAHRDVHERVKEHNRAQAEMRRDVEEAARDLSERLPGARTRIDGTTAFVYMNLEPGEVRIGLDGDAVSLVLNDVPRTIADAVVFAVSRFLPSVQTSEDEYGEYVDGYAL